MNRVESINVSDRAVFCEGDPHASMGHPRIYLMIGESGQASCPYCGRRYVLNVAETDNGDIAATGS
ncbi:MAG: zinc-finger domain-containing protein [Rhodospirillaceae bacterium]|nr:zinc-finger domain-containing protein [Rhodospirillaceae bacterium]MBT5374453.1 zinc-finger domain-containing protein [Rhodospirillaceae bacterium]MBT5659501.1 zinc-finger domain-containing protein [Rhodospirillaceae bacterium]MBT5752831.1 zinc-finger domain-containing protein [Rhodospirillaceae bacterium]